MKSVSLPLFLLGFMLFMSCSKDDNEIKPDYRQENEGNQKDGITWTKTTYNYYAFEWHHQAKGDTCTTTRDTQSFYVGRNFNTGNSYVKHLKGSTPIVLNVNNLEKEICPFCSLFGTYWYQHVSGFKYYFYWGNRKYWVTDLPASLKS